MKTDKEQSIGMKTFTDRGVCVQVEVPKGEPEISRMKFSLWTRILGWYWKSVYTGIPFGYEVGMNLPWGYPYRYPNREKVFLVLFSIFMVSLIVFLGATFFLARDVFLSIVGVIVVMVLALAFIIGMFALAAWGDNDDAYLSDD